MYAVNLLKQSRIPFPEIYDPSFIPANYLPHANNVVKEIRKCYKAPRYYLFWLQCGLLTPRGTIMRSWG
ncbi:hypothetical protein AB3S75_000452 [Citrus x aurantiifolia]